jgi:hypothetical protein
MVKYIPWALAYGVAFMLVSLLVLDPATFASKLDHPSEFGLHIQRLIPLINRALVAGVLFCLWILSLFWVIQTSKSFVLPLVYHASACAVLGASVAAWVASQSSEAGSPIQVFWSALPVLLLGCAVVIGSVLSCTAIASRVCRDGNDLR